MADSPTVPPGVTRNVVRAGTQDPFKKDAADQAAERSKGEAKREASAPPGGRRISSVGGIGGDIKAKKYNDQKAVDDMS